MEELVGLLGVVEEGGRRREMVGKGGEEVLRGGEGRNEERGCFCILGGGF